MVTTKLKRLVVVLCMLILIDECHLHEDILPKKNSVNAQNEDLINLNYYQRVDDLEWQKDSINRADISNIALKSDSVTFEEDKHDLDLKEIADGYYESKENKRVIGAIVLIAAVVGSGAVLGNINVMCPSLKKKSKEVEDLKNKIGIERRQLNSDWGIVDKKTRFLQRLAADSETLRRSITKMDELKRDLITLVNPNALKEISELHKDLKEQLQHANQTTYPEIEKANEKKMDNFIASLAITIVMSFLLAASIDMLKHPEHYAQHVFKVQRGAVHVKGVKNFVKSKLQFKHLAKGALAGLAIGLMALQLAMTIKACNSIENKLTNVKNEQLEALQNFTRINKQMLTLNKYIDSNYSMVWRDMASNDFMSFVNEAIATASNSENITAKTTQSIKDMKDFKREFPKTLAKSGAIDYVKVEKLTRKLISGFLDGNHKLNCYRKKMKIVKVISDRCASGDNSFNQLWKMGIMMDKANLKDCIVDHKYVTEDGMRNIIKKVMKQKKKQEICVRNNEVKRMIICQAYIKDEDDLVSKVDNLTQSDVDFFVKTCELPPVDRNLKIQICRLKENQNNNASKVLQMYSKYNLTSLKESWNTCNFTKAQIDFICNSKQNGVRLDKIEESLKNYDVEMVAAAYNSCALRITRGAEMVICLAHRKNKVKLIEKYEEIYGKMNVQKVIKTKCSKNV